MVDVNQFGTSLQSIVHVPKDQKAVLTADNDNALKQRSVENFGLVAETFQTTVGLEVINVKDLKNVGYE